MNVIFHADAAEFRRRATPLLLQNEAVNSLMLGLLPRLAGGETLITLEEGAAVKSVALLTPFSLILTFVENDDLEDLADALKSRGLGLPGVVGPAQESERFARDWAALNGLSYALGMNQGIYRLSQVTFPRHMNGKMRLAGVRDLPLILQWLDEFCQETMANDPQARTRASDGADKRIQDGDFYLWEHQGDTVGMAAKTRPTQNGVSINSVYTPQLFRRRGYASALVAQLSQKMLEARYKFCFLYTDLTNAVANRVYQNIGYQMVGHSRHYLFT